MAAARRITVEAFIERGDGSRVRVEDLTGRERERLSMLVRCTMLDTAFAGTASFHAPNPAVEAAG